ncbi:MAG: hypothetical protein KC766_36195, partial [Myxococcales bacterium]|nr:hypothetical protein [Myxococcales bacterium]
IPESDGGGITAGGTATEVKPENPPSTGSGGGGSTEPDSSATAEPDPTTKPTATSKPTSQPTSTKPAGNAAACDQCIAVAGSSPAAAANYYRQCTDAGKKATCQSKVRASAPNAARAAAFNGNCSAAKGIVAAANAMGAGSGALNAAVKTCK